jgi:hypothetical protein
MLPPPSENLAVEKAGREEDGTKAKANAPLRNRESRRSTLDVAAVMVYCRADIY